MSNSARIRPLRWLKSVNKVMIGWQHLGIYFGPMVLTVSDRKSGKPRSTPVTPMTVDGNRYVVAGLPGWDWAANAPAAGEATLPNPDEFDALAGRLAAFRLDPVNA